MQASHLTLVSGEHGAAADAVRVELRQPNLKALAWLSGRKDALLTGVEIALDLVYNCAADSADAEEFFARHLIRRWQGKEHPVFYFEETRYDASRAAPNYFALYPEPYSRITGELHVLHIEWRATKARAVRSAGIATPGDLLKFPFRKFWKRRLLLVGAPDPERLGRYLRNRINGTRSRKPQTATYRLNGREIEISVDRRRGGIALSHSSLQETLDRYRTEDVRRLFKLLSNEPFLPAEEPSLEEVEEARA